MRSDIRTHRIDYPRPLKECHRLAIHVYFHSLLPLQFCAKMGMLHYILEKESIKIKEILAAKTQQIGYANQPQKAHSASLSFLLCQITSQKHKHVNWKRICKMFRINTRCRKRNSPCIKYDAGAIPIS